MPASAGAQLDSSDDEGAAPALSAAAEELLGVSTVERERLAFWENTSGHNKAAIYTSNRSNQPAHEGLNHEHAFRNVSPFSTGSPRVVRIKRNSSTDSGRPRQATSAAGAGNGSPLLFKNASKLRTPAPRLKSALAPKSLYSNSPRPTEDQASAGSLGPSTGSASDPRPSVAGVYPESNFEHAHISRTNSSKSKNDENGLHNSLRVKRVGKVQGRYLSGPARRGVIRRQSGEDQSPIHVQEQDNSIHNLSIWDRKDSKPQSDLHSVTNISTYQPARSSPNSSPRNEQKLSLQGAEKGRNNGITGLRRPYFEQETGRSKSAEERPQVESMSPASTARYQEQQRQGQQQLQKQNQSQRLAFKVIPIPQLPSLHDQENEPPPTFKRNKVNSDLLGATAQSRSNAIQSAETVSPPRRALAALSQNTPRRPAPPPPKMTMLETATATAGGAASTTQRRLKRQYISVNGKMFTKMECIGRGGSGRVYRVMAENFKHFALKRVSLDEVDQATIRGFKGEIDLLRKLENVDRVIRIYDFEINDEKKTLSVLMDLGELDLKKILDPRLDDETGAFDITFTRYIWKEMLECVQAIHAHEVVHSDLKPANFVSAQGRLKLIDFGIANAIQDDTVNVHREQQIGTPNYMAPEALLDINASSGRKSTPSKLMKLGKPSDVWSLACILYQVVYGKPPFGHIPNQMNKVMAITDRSHNINFPQLGVGGVPVPSGLVRTMRRCLEREPARRPTISELLNENDPFLHPDAPGSINLNAEHLKVIQHNVLRIIEAHGIPEVSEHSKEATIKLWLDEWGPQLFAKMKDSIERAS
ncbi:MAG: hypothetical protein MMC23_006512 [Stictis urceolatum]|nr:hypothetical protein [Stictis urceolata]